MKKSEGVCISFSVQATASLLGLVFSFVKSIVLSSEDCHSWSRVATWMSSVAHSWNP